MEQYIFEERPHPRVAVLRIDRPKALNAINMDVLAQLREKFEALEADRKTGAVVLTGTGKAFVAGADIALMAGYSATEARVFSERGQHLMTFIEEMSLPVIGAINGYTMGGGLELALACDIRMASENALFAMPEASLGIVPGFGGTARLPRLIGLSRARYLLLSCRRLTAQEACTMGLVAQVFPTADALMENALALAVELAERSRFANGLVKSAILAESDMNLPAAVAFETHMHSLSFDHSDQKEGMKAFMEKRKPHFAE